MKKLSFLICFASILAFSCLCACAAQGDNAGAQTSEGTAVLAQAPQIVSFNDVKPGTWYEEGVQYVSQKGLMNGVGNEQFDPSGTVTRGMLVTILYRMEGTPGVTGPSSFDDVKPGSYYEDAVIWAANSSIVSGYSTASFGPDDPVTREQVATILYRYSSFKGYDTSKAAELASFSDADQVSQYALDAMRWAVAEGLINGTDTGALAPEGTTTRAQFATIIMRYDKAENAEAQDGDTQEQSPGTEVPTNADDGTQTPSGASTPSGNDTPGNGGDKPIGSTPTIVVDQVTAKPGDKNVEVTVSIHNNLGILGMTLSVQYDAQVLTLKDGASGDAVTGVLAFTKPGEYVSPCRFMWDGQEITPNETKDGTILTLKFDVSESASEGVYPITISYNDYDIVDNNLSVVTVEIKNGSITVVK